MYRFIRGNAACFDGFEAADIKDHKPAAPASVLVTVRKNSGSKQVVLHVLNRDYDAQTKSMRPQSNAEVSLDKALVSVTKPYAKLLSFDGPAQQVDLVQSADKVTVRIPELRLWTLIVLE
jgi:hypothetical protein